MTPEGAAILDGVLTTAAGITQSAYHHGADIVHLSAEPTEITVMVFGGASFRFTDFETANSSFDISRLDPDDPDRTEANGTSAAVYTISLPFNVDYSGAEPALDS